MLPPDAITLSESQRGVLARSQLVRLMGEFEADNLLRSGWFGPITPHLRGMYRVLGGAALPEQYAFAAALRARPKATITGPLVLGLLGIEAFTTASPFEILTQPGRRLTRVPYPHRCDPDPGRAVATHGHIRVAGPIDGLIDTAAFVERVGDRAIRVAWDQIRWRGLAKPHRLEERIAQLRDDAPGAVVLERLLELPGGVVAESEGERGLGSILGCFDPPPEPQVWVTPARRTDYYFRRVRTGLEYLGEADHAHVAGRLADDERDAELRAEGVRLHYVTGRDLSEPTTLLATIAGFLTVRAHELGVRPPVASRPLPARLG